MFILLFVSIYNLNAQSKELFTQVDSIVYNGYTLKVVSYCVDDSIANDQPNLFYPICYKQDIFCIDNNGRTIKCFYKVRTINERAISGKNYQLLDNIVTEIGIIKGKRGTAFIVYGYGGCNSCSEIYSIFSLKGDLMYFLYQKGDEEYSNLGDLNAVAKIYNFDVENYLSGNYSKKRIQLHR